MLLHDRNRRPPDWVSAMKSGEFAVFLTDVRIRVPVDAQGKLVERRAAQTCLVFENFDEAVAYCERRAAAIENMHCEIYDHRGMANSPVLEIVNPKHAARLGSRISAKKKMLYAGILIFCAVAMIVLDYWRHLGYLPTVLGINLGALGLRLLHWGYSDLERLAAAEKRLAVMKGN